MDSVVGPTGPQFGSVTTARCRKFRPPRTLALSVVRVFGNAVPADTTLRFAIYRISDGAKVWDSGLFGSATNEWIEFLGITGVTVNGNEDHLFAWLFNSTSGTTAPFRTPHAPVHANFFGASAPPFGGRSIGIAEYAQFALTTGGQFPATLPALTAAGYVGGTTGTLPVAFLEGAGS